MDKTKVFAYLRVSDSSQVKGDGFARQEKAIKDYAQANSLEVVEIYKEDWTGTELDRPVLAKLLLTLELNGHGIKTIIIENLSRLSRDLMIQEAIIRDFQKKGFNLISVMEGSELLVNDPTRKLIRQIFGAIAEYDKSMLVAKMKAAKDRIRAKTGRCEGRKGYEDTKEGQRILAHIHKLREKPEQGKRRTLQQVADVLNSEGVKTLEGREWNLWRVDQAINSKKYSQRTRKTDVL